MRGPDEEAKGPPAEGQQQRFDTADATRRCRWEIGGGRRPRLNLDSVQVLPPLVDHGVNEREVSPRPRSGGPIKRNTGKKKNKKNDNEQKNFARTSGRDAKFSVDIGRNFFLPYPYTAKKSFRSGCGDRATVTYHLGPVPYSS